MNMNAPIRQDDEEKPLDPAVENVRRKMIRFMLVNLALLGVALIAVVGAVVYKRANDAPVAPVAGTTLATPAAGQTIQGSIPLPSGARIVSQSLSGDRLSLEVEETSGQRAIYLFDVGAGRVIARFAVTPQL